mmetsp:Transcript_34899/g.86634  ORF Transcript_34899/g.86634 Transcript_34899/m.86634 type:complete len:248 (+) Transcript_34899:705-1448(+)
MQALACLLSSICICACVHAGRDPGHFLNPCSSLCGLVADSHTHSHTDSHSHTRHRTCMTHTEGWLACLPGACGAVRCVLSICVWNEPGDMTDGLGVRPFLPAYVSICLRHTTQGEPSPAPAACRLSFFLIYTEKTSAYPRTYQNVSAGRSVGRSVAHSTMTHVMWPNDLAQWVGGGRVGGGKLLCWFVLVCVHAMCSVSCCWLGLRCVCQLFVARSLNNTYIHECVYLSSYLSTDWSGRGKCAYIAD